MESSADDGIRSTSILVDFDADAAVDAVKDVAGDSCGLCAEYNVRTYNVLFVNPVLEQQFESLDELYEVGDDLHTTLYVDFTQQELLDDYHPAFGDVRALVTYLEGFVFVRVIVGTEGLFVALEPDSPVTPVVEAIETTLADATD